MLRILAIVFLAALAASLAFGACLAACGVAVVSVAVHDGPDFTAPVPLMLPLAAIRFAPEEAFAEAGEHLDGAAARGVVAFGRLLEEIEAIEADGDDEAIALVEVESPGELVRITREEGDLVVRVGTDAGETEVSARWPIRALREMTAACSEEGGAAGTVRCDLRELAHAALRHARSGAVEVRSPEANVSVSIW